MSTNFLAILRRQSALCSKEQYFGRTYKEITRDDLRLPMIAGMGRAKRLLATIGVTRGLGDHQLVALNQLADVPVKPFMSAVPEVGVILFFISVLPNGHLSSLPT